MAESRPHLREPGRSLGPRGRGLLRRRSGGVARLTPGLHLPQIDGRLKIAIPPESRFSPPGMLVRTGGTGSFIRPPGEYAVLRG